MTLFNIFRYPPQELFDLLDDGDGGIHTGEFFHGLARMKGGAVRGQCLTWENMVILSGGFGGFDGILIGIHRIVWDFLGLWKDFFKDFIGVSVSASTR